jgi:hypothetical protein
MCRGAFSVTLRTKFRRRQPMDILVLTTIVLTGIALERVIFVHARKRAEYENTIADRLARYAGRNLGLR